MPGCVQDFNRDLVQGFLGVLLEALGISLSLDFWLHSIMPVTWNPEYPPWELTASSRTCIHFLTQTPLRGWGSYSPWKSLKVLGILNRNSRPSKWDLQNCSRYWKVLKFQLLKQFKENCKGKGANTKTFGIKFPDVEELKIDIDVFFSKNLHDCCDVSCKPVIYVPVNSKTAHSQFAHFPLLSYFVKIAHMSVAWAYVSLLQGPIRLKVLWVDA